MRSFATGHVARHETGAREHVSRKEVQYEGTVPTEPPQVQPARASREQEELGVAG